MSGREAHVERFDRLDVVAAEHAVTDGATLLDVREEHEWAAGHAPGALHIPLGALPARIEELPRHRPVLVICRSGRRSAEAAGLLAGLLGGRAGDVANVEGGMVAWAGAGLPVVAGGGSTGRVA